MVLLLSLLVVTLVSLALYAYLCTSYWVRRGVPQLPGAYFPFGHLWKTVFLRRTFGEECCDLYWMVPSSKPLAGAYMFTKPAVVVRDPELVKQVLVKDFQHFHDRGFYTNEDVDPLSGHLFMVPGQKWRALRTKLTPTFTSGKMKMMFPMVERCASELVQVLAQQPSELEFAELLKRYSTDVIASCAFGLETHCLQNPDHEFRYWGNRISKPSTGESLISVFCEMFPWIAKTFRIRSIAADIDRYFTDLVKKTMEHRDTHGITRPDFLQLLMKLRDNSTKDEKPKLDEADSRDLKLNIGELAAQTAVFFTAGYETSSSTLSFALYELAWNQKIQRKLQQEIDDTLEKSDGQLMYENVMSMSYLDKVVSETLRKYPVLPVLNREVTQDYQVPETDWVLKKGTAVILPIMSFQHDPQYFPEPEQFDPERFSDEEKSKRHSFTYLPFGDGPRNCIGMRFGLMQTKIGLASVLRHYKVEPCSRTSKELKMDPLAILLNPVSGIWLKCTNRA